MGIKKSLAITPYLKLSIDEISNLPNETKIVILEELIRFHNKLYFIENSPIISDPDFDKLTQMLEKLKPESEALYEIIGEIGDVAHSTKMLSIEKKYTYTDIQKWLMEIEDNSFLIEPKFDGMAARFQNNILATRGNGIKGENITKRFKFLNIIGKIDKTKDYIDGEITIPLTYFNGHLKNTYKNPRNAVVGIIKAKRISDEGIKALQDNGVHFVIYDKAISYKVNKSELLDEEKFEELLEKVLQTDYPTDGMVIKATDLNLKKRLGATEHHYKWQIAYKLPAERKWSKVIEIKDQVGRTGRITSVAVISPIDLSGATVTNVTLHNFDYALNSKIGVNSKVEVCRSGEVIPFITKAMESKKPHYTLVNIKNIHCPICNTKVIINNKYLECPNNNCPARLSQSIEYFFKVLKVEELGLKTIIKFMNEFKLKEILDFYKLDEERIANLDGFGKKSANNITTNIKRTLNANITHNQLLQALGLKEIGPATSRWIINRHGFNNLNKLTVEDLQDVKGIGPIKALNFINDLKTKWHIVDSLLKLNLKFKENSSTNKLTGKSFCITGKKVTYSRDELINLINTNGGIYHANVTKDLDYLIAGDDAGSKLIKAKEFGVNEISEEEFLKMIN